MARTISTFLTVSIFALLALISIPSLAAATDAAGCKDHPLFSRMNGYSISECDAKSFDAEEFYTSKDNAIKVEGKKTFISYSLNEGEETRSEIQVKRNYENAIKSQGGSLIYGETYQAYMKLAKDGKEIWVSLNVYGGANDYTLTIVEKGSMDQEVTAGRMLDLLNKQGFIALYINFDTNKSTIKPESKPIVDEIVKLLKENPSLKVGIEGHTDNTGTPAGNAKLSQERSDSVKTAVVSAGIDGTRLSAVGRGQDKPIADNGTEAGRTKNRRVEIVKK